MKPPVCEQYRQYTPSCCITNHDCFEDHLLLAKLRHDGMYPLLSCGTFGVALVRSAVPPQGERRKARDGITVRRRLVRWKSKRQG